MKSERTDKCNDSERTENGKNQIALKKRKYKRQILDLIKARSKPTS